MLRIAYALYAFIPNWSKAGTTPKHIRARLEVGDFFAKNASSKKISAGAQPPPY